MSYLVHLKTSPLADTLDMDETMGDLLDALQSSRIVQGPSVSGHIPTRSIGLTANVDGARDASTAITLSTSELLANLQALGARVDVMHAEADPEELASDANWPEQIVNLLTGADAAKELGMSRQRLHQLAATEDFPRPLGRVGRATVWSASSIEAFKQEREEREAAAEAHRIAAHLVRANTRIVQAGGARAARTRTQVPRSGQARSR